MKLTRRGLVALYVVAVLLSLGIGMCGPLWDAMPWAVAP